MDTPCAYGQPIRVQAAHTHIHIQVAHRQMGCPYANGLPVCVWDSPYVYGQDTYVGWNIATRFVL